MLREYVAQTLGEVFSDNLYYWTMLAVQGLKIHFKIVLVQKHTIAYILKMLVSFVNHHQVTF